MTIETLIKLNNDDELRFYEESEIVHNFFIDEYTPYSYLTEVNINREVKCFFTTIVGSNGEIDNYWTSVILKEEEK